MRRVLICCAVLILFSVVCSGEIILNDGLVLQGGAERIEMRVGEKVYLRVHHSVWKYPVLRGLEFSSKNPVVAYADTYGWIHAQKSGRTVISAWNDAGDNGTIEVIVKGRASVSVGTAICLFFFVICILLTFFGNNFFRCFE